MERRVVLISERAYSSTVNGIERIESQSIPGIGMLTEVDITNDDHVIVPGSYVQVILDVQVPPLLEIPAEALTTRADQPQVPTLDDQHRIHYKPVVVADDDGQTVRLASGLSPGERVALDLGGAAQDGSPVQVVESKPPGAGSPGK